MPGTITLRPVEANLTHNTDLIGKMSPYVAFIVGNDVYRSQVCKKGGKNPVWGDAVTIPYSNEASVVVEVMDKDKFTRDDNIGTTVINLKELQRTGQSSQWYPLTYKNKAVGEVLLEASLSGEGFGGYNQGGINQAGFVGTEGYRTGGLVESEYVANRAGYVQQQETFVAQAPAHERRIFTEQQQVVEPRTFIKEVDVVETRSVLQNIEVLEPTKVIREVQYTQAVPVTKQIEVIEPRVVMKEVEVMEPRLVTKTIQVVENVPVKKRIEVIENVTRMQTVETFEPQTFTKQVEITDYIPVQKQVTVTEPVHLKKVVEFVEPVITTKTITKELREAVIVDESITTTVGPASLVAESEVYGQYFITLSEEERLLRFKEYERLRATGVTEYEIDRQFVTRGWGNDFTRHYNYYNTHLHNHNHHHHHHQSGVQHGSHQEGNILSRKL